MNDARLTYRIAAIPGDGVGPEVVAAGRAALEAAGSAFGFEIRWSDIAAGGNAIDAYGVAIRPEDVTRAGEHDAMKRQVTEQDRTLVLTERFRIGQRGRRIRHQEGVTGTCRAGR